MSIFFEKIVRPILFRLDPERAHELGMKALRLGIGSRGAQRLAEDPSINAAFGPIERFGLKFGNPLGVAAGFDKNGHVVKQLAALGFGFIEVGTVTLEPQPGNPRPRIFRLTEDHALINRLGFNNDGAAKIAERLSQIDRNCIVGVNIGRNRDVPNEIAVENYVRTFEIMHPVADYIAVNVSSPNTPNLRELQTAENLEVLVTSIQQRNDELGRKPILVKIAPDLGSAELQDIVNVCAQTNVAGMIATNTTTGRSGLESHDVQKYGPGGLSGKPINEISNRVISQIFRYSNGSLPIVGVGGIFSAEDAFEKIACGASLLQAYTGFVYSGPAFPYDIVTGLATILRKRGFVSLDEAVGSAVR
jgi:dihydroorotate dehydrogenase